jgi:hypothetical protein
MFVSLDLSAAFDIESTDLLIKRLKIIGLLDDVIGPIKVWLENRSYYVSKDGINLILYNLLLGTVQGLILGPVFYLIFESLTLRIWMLLPITPLSQETNNSLSTTWKKLSKQ